ncbi:MAG TPA: cytochrome c oxidase assembly protein, partial [Ktedonobacteraceae bacterium]|nr:cytochrome c oxidase assembly protein [Ktedonobacteraceae bacterium]
AVILGFALRPLYAPYAHLVTAPGGFSALQDQRLGAGIMWTIGDFPFVAAICILGMLWLATQTDESEMTMHSKTIVER